MSDKVIKRYSLSKQVSDKLEQMIQDGEYAIGDKIPTELELMDLFNVSRNTIREAIQSLTSAGILIVKQGDGTYVKSNNRFNGCMNMKYEQVSADDIREARNALEITIAHLAAERRTEEDMEQIHIALVNRKELKSTLKENTRADIEFHMAIAEACHNAILYDLYQSISSFIESQITQRHSDTTMNVDRIDMLHEELYCAILEQDAEKASICAAKILEI